MHAARREYEELADELADELGIWEDEIGISSCEIVGRIPPPGRALTRRRAGRP